MQHDDDDATSLTLVLQGAIPTLTALDATALARVTRLELRDLTPTRAQLAALAQQLPSLEDVALVRCDVERLQPGEGAQAPAAPPLPSSVRALDVQWSTLGPLSADLDEADRQLTSANAVALSLLRSPGELRRLVATAPAESILGDVVALPALTHLSLVDAEFLLSGMRRLLDHPGLTHVELHHQHQPTWPVEPLREGFRWRELALVDTNGDNLPNVPLGKIDRVVFRHRVFDRRFGSEPSWGELVAAAGEAGAALACEPDGEGRFTVDMRLEDAVQVGEFEEWKRHRCLCYGEPASALRFPRAVPQVRAAVRGEVEVGAALAGVLSLPHRGRL